MIHPNFSGQKILVAGASGFIGSYLCRKLSKVDDVEIHALSRAKRSGSNKIKWWQGDISDHDWIENLLQDVKPDYIFNLASHVEGSRDVSLILPTFRSNLLGQLNLMIAAHKIECKRFISTGSMDEPDQKGSRHKVISPYAVAKGAAGLYGEMFHALYSLPYVHLRVSMVYGPGQKDVRKLIPYTILSMLRGKSPALSSGRRKIDWIYIEDVVDGILAAAETPNIEGERLDIGSGKLVSISSVQEILADLIDPTIKPNFGALSDRRFEHERIANISETVSKINWKPRISIKNGLKKTVRWYSEKIHRFSHVLTCISFCTIVSILTTTSPLTDILFES